MGEVSCLEREFLGTSASLYVSSSYIVEVNREDLSYLASSREAVRDNGTIDAGLRNISRPVQIICCLSGRQILSGKPAQIFVCRQILSTFLRSCANICLEANTFLRSCANICLQANTFWRTCANICLAGKYSLEKLRKYLSGGKYCPGTNTRNYYLYLLWIFVQGV